MGLEERTLMDIDNLECMIDQARENGDDASELEAELELKTQLLNRIYEAYKEEY